MFHAIDLFWIAHGQFEAILATQGRLLMFSDQDQCDQRSNRVNWSKAMRKTRSFDHQLFVNCYACCVMCTTFETRQGEFNKYSFYLFVYTSTSKQH